MIDEERLRDAAREAGEALLDSLPQREQCRHDFSPRFEAKIEPLLKRNRHPLRRTLTRAACILLALLLTGGVWLGADASAREAITGWLRGTYETLFVYRFVGEADPDTLNQEYELGWIPEDWTEIDAWTDIAGGSSVYLDAEDHLCHFSYYTNPGSAPSIITEAKAVTIEIAGQPADYYNAEGLDESSTLVWMDQKTGVLLVLSAWEELSVMLKIAESVTTK